MKSPVQSLYNWYRGVIRNPKYRWWVVLGTLVYLVSPIDVIPDFLPFAGQIDDALLVTILVSEVYQWIMDRVKASTDYEVASNDSSQSAANTGSTVDVEATPIK
jgi:uncharacterized membrane protein YkvA (DUF1232 family)